MPQVIGYARVSTEDQDPSLQTEALRKAGCSQIYCDHGVSGAKRDREELANAIAALEYGDKLVVWKLDRLARSVRHLIDLLEDFGRRGIQFESLTEKIDTDTAHGEFVFHILAGFAQMERRLISERTKAGMAEARRRGATIGRPLKLDEATARKIHRKLNQSDVEFIDLAVESGVTVITLKRALYRYRLIAH